MTSQVVIVLTSVALWKANVVVRLIIKMNRSNTEILETGRMKHMNHMQSPEYEEKMAFCTLWRQMC